MARRTEGRGVTGKGTRRMRRSRRRPRRMTRKTIRRRNKNLEVVTICEFFS